MSVIFVMPILLQVALVAFRLTLCHTIPTLMNPRKKPFENIMRNGESIAWLSGVLMQFSTVFELYCGSQCTYVCFHGVRLTSTLQNIFSKPLAAFPHNHCRNNAQQ